MNTLCFASSRQWPLIKLFKHFLTDFNKKKLEAAPEPKNWQTSLPFADSYLSFLGKLCICKKILVCDWLIDFKMLCIISLVD